MSEGTARRGASAGSQIRDAVDPSIDHSPMHMRSLKIDAGSGSAAPEEKHTISACSWSCSFCQYRTTVRNGRIVNLRPLEGDSHTMCLRGFSRIHRTYSRERIKYPLKRAGKRGEGKWERITWEEAIETIVSRWKTTSRDFGPRANSWYCCSGSQGQLHGNVGLIRRLFQALEVTLWDFCFDSASGVGFAQTGLRWLNFNEGPDWKNSVALVCWGANPCESNIQHWQHIVAAQEQGVKLVVVDPLFSVTASKADCWIHPYPGTDAALALGICKYLIDENLCDMRFLRDHTCAPFIVHPESGRYLRLSDIEGAQQSAREEEDAKSPVVVWDRATGHLVTLDAALDPCLEDIPPLDGWGQVKTTWEVFSDHVSGWTSGKVSEITDITEEEIVELATLCASGKVCHYVNMGSCAHTNGVHTARALACIAALTGNFGKPGASFGGFDACWGEFNGQLQIAIPGKEYNRIPVLCACDIMQTGMFKGEPYPVKNLWITHGNLLGSSVNSNRVRKEFFDAMEFIVVTEIDFTEDARYADLVLPACDMFEYEDVVGLSDERNVRISEQAIQPLYESKPEGEIANLFARAFGLDEVALSYKEYWERLFDTEITRPIGKDIGISIEALRKRKNMRYVAEKPYIAYRDLQFYSDTGRLTFYLDAVVPRLPSEKSFNEGFERLPRYFENPESGRNSPLKSAYPFIILSWRNKTRIHTNGYMKSWAHDIRPEPIVWINPADAAALSVENNEYVEIYNDRGHVVVKAVLSESMRPGILCYPKGYQRTECKEGSLTEITTDHYDPIGVNCSFFDNRVAIRPWKGR